MAWSLAEVRKHTDAPVVAVLYTHFHYIGGTRAVFDAEGEVPIYGHAGIEGNLQRIGGEVSAAAQRGLVHQMAIMMPTEGPDGTVNLGLGMEFRHPDHAPFTREVLLPTTTFTDETTLNVAGLEVVVTPAPSDADDSVTFWFPELEVGVNNILWPSLFNVFAIRGEEYRDPRILLTGLDHLHSLGADHLICTHGPPLSGRAEISEHIEEYRDSIQFMWDQTVRGLNRGLTMDELTQFVQLPEAYERTYLTGQYYGLVEHHVRQIHVGLRGWFDGHDASLFPVPPVERATRLIAGFGGADEVRRQAAEALAEQDLRWALELASWLVRCELDKHGRVDGGSESDRQLLASVLRAIGQRTTSANVRNWTLTRALELEGSLDLGRFRTHRFGERDVLANPPEVYVRALRVLLDPERAAGINDHLRWDFVDGTAVGLHVRRGVAVPTNGAGADLSLALDLATWAKIAANKLTIGDAVASGAVTVEGDPSRVYALLGCFDHRALADSGRNA
jgi:alkyl sulfatase BDS1-like metallo-beta-lactamase superfamily hydrolase